MGPAYHNNKIYTSGTKAADVLSHEIGHAHYDKRKIKSVSDAIGKVAHKAYLKTGGMLNHVALAPTAGIIAGVRSGKKAGNKHLSNSFRTYELGAADEINLDNVRRLLGKYRNK